MKSIEEKVRLQLHLECFQLRLGQLGSQLRGVKLSLAEALVIVERMTAQHNHPVGQQPAVDVVDKELSDVHEGEIRRAACAKHITHIIDGQKRADQPQTHQKVKRHSAAPIIPFDAEAPGQPQDEGCCQCPEKTTHTFDEESATERDRLFLAVIKHVDLSGKEKCHDSPNAPD